MEIDKLKRNKQVGAKKIHKEGLKSIKTSKIVVPLYKREMPNDMREELEGRAKAYGKNPDSDFISVRLYEFNTILSKKLPHIRSISWGEILNYHLVKWIIVKTNGIFDKLTKSRINLLVEEYFVYMPFILQRMHPNDNRPFGLGFDKELEEKDYKVNDYARYRVKEAFKIQIVDPLMNIEIKNVE